MTLSNADMKSAKREWITLKFLNLTVHQLNAHEIKKTEILKLNLRFDIYKKNLFVKPNIQPIQRKNT